jgi:hypothetical protein
MSENARLTVMLVLVLGAFIMTMVSAAGKAPWWVPVTLLCVIELIRTLPLGK